MSCTFMLFLIKIVLIIFLCLPKSFGMDGYSYYKDLSLYEDTEFYNNSNTRWNIGTFSDKALVAGAQVLVDTAQSSQYLLNNANIFHNLKKEGLLDSSAFANYVYSNGYTMYNTGGTSTTFFSKIVGSGDFVVNMRSGAEVNLVSLHSSGASYTGDARVLSGSLNLFGLSDGNNLLNSSISIGGGYSSASLKQYYIEGGEMIGDNSVITINSNGSYILSSQEGSIKETIGGIILNGGSIINSTSTKNTTTLNAGTLTLCGTSIIDLGQDSMTINFSDSSKIAWAQGAKLIIRNYTSGVDDISFDGLTDAQISQIYFENTQSGTLMQAALFKKHIRPIPEARTYWLGLVLLGSILIHILKTKKTALMI